MASKFEVVCPHCEHTWTPKHVVEPKCCPKCARYLKKEYYDERLQVKDLYPLNCIKCGNTWYKKKVDVMKCPKCAWPIGKELPQWEKHK